MHLQQKSNQEEHWPKTCKHGKLQSPVALNKRFACHSDIPSLKFENFKKYKKCCIKNTGYTWNLTLPEHCHCDRPKISGAKLVGRYTLENLHVHWPAEHVIGEIRYDLEMHMVFYADRYRSFKESLIHPLGVAVLSIPFSETLSTRSKNFKTISEAVKLVFEKPGRSTIIRNEEIDFYQFLPYDHRMFYHYFGSFTTPPCTEYVHWIVMNNAGNIAQLDLKDLKNVYDNHGELVESNNRDIQPLNERIVTFKRV
ncbi:hypothetical protein ABEB36_012567 [Hypothenemus hampei]|uniref:carbonic anhydrase n=1 Tax=Hypothenemus hampei TaxID=57062 RepID=A0ABD1EBN7_HYPHA